MGGKLPDVSGQQGGGLRQEQLPNQQMGQLPNQQINLTQYGPGASAPPPIPEPEPLSPGEFGELASKLTNNPVVVKAFKDVESDLMVSWAATTPLEREKRDSLYTELLAVRRVYAKLQQLWTTTKHKALHEQRLRVA
jgi:hypothetical protein